MRMIMLSALVLLPACLWKQESVEDRYYSLVLEASEERQPAMRHRTTAHVNLTEVILPDYLMLRSLAIQTSTNELELAKHHHWAEPLDEAVRKVLVWDLAARLPSLDISYGSSVDEDCSIIIEFDRLHSTSTGRVLVSGRYTLTNKDHVKRHEFDVSQPLWADGYTSAVAVMRQALDVLSEEMKPLVAACAVPPPLLENTGPASTIHR